MDDGDKVVVQVVDADEEVVVADDRSQDGMEAVADHTYVAAVVEVARKDPEVVDADIYGRTLFF